MSDAKLPLENVASERAVLGSLIGDVHLFWTVKEKMRQDLFTTPVHQNICKVLHWLADNGGRF